MAAEEAAGLAPARRRAAVRPGRRPWQAPRGRPSHRDAAGRAAVDVPHRRATVRRRVRRDDKRRTAADRQGVAVPALPDRGAARLPGGRRRHGGGQVRAVPAGRRPARGPRTGGAQAPGRPLRLVYTGKFAPRWNTYEMTSLPRLLAARGIDAELHMIGDKIHDDRKDPGFTGPHARGPGDRRGRHLARRAPARRGDARDGRSATSGCPGATRSMDASLELSTKVLEMRRARPARRPQPHADAREPPRRRLPAVRRDRGRRRRRLAERTEPAGLRARRRRCLDAGEGVHARRRGGPPPHVPVAGVPAPLPRAPAGEARRASASRATT